MTEPLDLDELEYELKCKLGHTEEYWKDFIATLITELREARERIYDLTKCWACDDGRDDETCTCTDERKGIISKLKGELREAREKKPSIKPWFFDHLDGTQSKSVLKGWILKGVNIDLTGLTPEEKARVFIIENQLTDCDFTMEAGE